MKRCGNILCWVSGLVLLLAGSGMVLAAGSPPVHIITFKQNVDADVATEDLERLQGFNPHFIYRHALRGAAGVIPPGRLQAIKNDPRVALVEEDQPAYLLAQTLPTGVNRIDADINTTANINGVEEPIDVDIAIIDSGVQLTHPDLNVFKYTYCKQQGANFKCTENDSTANDTNGHGTHVAGIAAAKDNTTGVVGVAPGARLWAVRVVDLSGNISVGTIIAAIDYVTSKASSIEVANLSIGAIGSRITALDTAITNCVNAGVVFVVAAGNENVNVSTSQIAGHPSAITVSALADFDGVPGRFGSGSVSFGAPANCTENVDDSFACFSNHGAGVNIMAPGVNILSTYLSSGTGLGTGTSMAAPHVAGAAAIYRLENPGSTPAQVKSGLIAAGTTNPCGSGAGGICTDDPDGIQERLLKLNCTDSDGDGLCNQVDNCPLIANPSQTNTDGDSMGDACDPDDDNDGLTDTDEINIRGTNPLLWDTDGDGLSDGAEVNTHGTNPLVTDTDGDALHDGLEVNTYGTNPLVVDTDGDGLTDGAEVFTHGTNPLLLDTDGDGLSDGAEKNTHGTNPLVVDTDGDGLSDGAEVNTHGTNPLVPDTDGDGLSDGAEVNTHGTNPLLWDTDGDGLSDGAEINTHLTNPLLMDTDGDGFDDGVEVTAGSNPNDPGSVPTTGAASGDINDDGMVDQRDVLLGLRALIGAVTLSAGELQRGDVAPFNGTQPVPDGAFKINDVLIIQRKIQGYINF